MTIDPMNTPIFGDVVPADPPRPIKIATALLLGSVVLAAGYGLYIGIDASFSAFLLPMALAVWFALGMRAGHGWARTASTILSSLWIMMMFWVVGTAIVDNWTLSAVIDLAVLGLSAGMLLTAIRLMWRSNVSDYFST
jgi:hypothetical protein